MVYLSTFALAPLGTWTAYREDNDTNLYQVPAGKTLTLVSGTLHANNATGYIYLKYDTSSTGSAGTVIGYYDAGNSNGYTMPLYQNIPTGNYVKAQDNVTDVDVDFIGIEHDT